MAAGKKGKAAAVEATVAVKAVKAVAVKGMKSAKAVEVADKPVPRKVNPQQGKTTRSSRAGLQFPVGR